MRNKMLIFTLILSVAVLFLAQSGFSQTPAADQKTSGVSSTKSGSGCKMNADAGQCACAKAGKACEGKCKTTGCQMDASAAKGKAEIQQKTCPVTGEPINKTVYLDYNGKKVYFCCAGCKAKFQKSPEQYMKKLN